MKCGYSEENPYPLGYLILHFSLKIHPCLKAAGPKYFKLNNLDIPTNIQCGNGYSISF